MEKNLGHATAYGYAKSKGYSGTEDEFARLMADYASVGQSAAESAEQAAASATSASGSAATASQAAQTATSKASEAVTAADTANIKASEASTSADTASAAATSASTSAQTATTAASTATTKASEASESATTATTAKTDAESARDAAAQSASEAAESARTLTIDSTLTQPGQAADAKATGDAIAATNERLDDTNAETTDIRVGADGTTYASAGAAVRGQITDVKSALNNDTSFSFSAEAVEGTVLTARQNHKFYRGQYVTVEVAPSGVINGGNMTIIDNDGTQHGFPLGSTGGPIEFTIENDAKTITIYAGASYVIGTATLTVTYTVKSVYGTIQQRKGYIEDGSVVSSKIGSGAVGTEKIADNAVTANKIADNAIAIDRLDFISHDPDTNLVNKTKMIPKSFVNGDSEHRGVVTATKQDWWATDFIPVHPGTLLHNGFDAGYFAFYDSEKNYVRGMTATTGTPKDQRFTNPRVTIPDGVAYVRATCTSTAERDICWMRMTIQIAPPDYGYLLDAKLNPNYGNPCDIDSRDICAFKKGICLGDSITAGYVNTAADSGIETVGYSYPENMERLTGIQMTKVGASGATTATFWNLYQNEDWSGHDFAILQFGINDVARQGAFNDVSIEAMDNLINKLETQNPGIKIFIATIIPAYMAGRFTTGSEAIRAYVSTKQQADDNVFLADIRAYGNVGNVTAYSYTHLTAYGYWRLAQDYVNLISYIMRNNPKSFANIQFINTEYANIDVTW